MVQTAATMTSKFSTILKPHEAQDYFATIKKNSVVQQLARKVPLATTGEQIMQWTGGAEANWVAEGGRKPSTEIGYQLKSFKPQKIAAISVVSAEVVRANPKGYLEELKASIAEAFAKAFDNAVLHGLNTPFDQSLSDTTKAVELGSGTSVYADSVEVLKLLVDAKKKLTGYVFAPTVEPTFLNAVDANGRPLFTEATYGETVPAVRNGRLLGRDTQIAEQVANGTTVGFAGDFNQIVWGEASGIKFDASDQTAVTLDGQLVSLWEHNLMAIRAEAEYGILINDTESFVKITEAA